MEEEAKVQKPEEPQVSEPTQEIPLDPPSGSQLDEQPSQAAATRLSSSSEDDERKMNDESSSTEEEDDWRSSWGRWGEPGV